MNLWRACGNRAANLALAACCFFIPWTAAHAADAPRAAAQARTIALEVAARKPVGGARTVRLARGDAVVLEIRADEKMQIHVHGYGVHAAVAPGAPVRLPLTTRFEGRFPVTAHLPRDARGHAPEPTLLYLEVYPP
jgi:hypothetical protein